MIGRTSAAQEVPCRCVGRKATCSASSIDANTCIGRWEHLHGFRRYSRPRRGDEHRVFYVRAAAAAVVGGALAGLGAWVGTGRSTALAVEGGLVAAVLLVLVGGYIVYAFTPSGDPRPGRGGVRTAGGNPAALMAVAALWFGVFAVIGLAMRH